MSSDFDNSNYRGIPLDWKAITPEATGRYAFYQTRVYGKLHFVKALSDDYRHDLCSTEALRKEFEIGYNLEHPNIARYLNFSDNVIFEEFIDGKTLAQMLAEDDPRLHDKKFVAKVARQLLEAVEYIHAMGVLHLDLKPENVMITRVGDNVKIIDFSCAYTPSDDSTQGFTLEYKAPEQGEGETNAYTDMYLVGGIMSAITERSGNKRRWKKFIAKATAEQPSQRFRTEAEALKAIPQPADKRKYRWVAEAFLVAVLGTMFLMWYGAGTDKPVTTEATSEPTAAPADSLPAQQPVAQPQPQVVEVNPTQAPKGTTDTRSSLENQIINTIHNNFASTIYPICPVDTAHLSEATDKFNRLNREAINKSLQYGE